MKSFDHKAIEKKWQKIWEEKELYKTPDSVEGKDNYYMLVEYPYPSGNLHVGHWYAFAVPDIFVRYRRMLGDNVLYPIGFDSFGLPAENAAIKHKLDPKKWTYENIDYMTKQIRSMGNTFDWSRKVVTSDPEYYKWTQWLFLQLYKNKLAYKKTSTVPWCDTCKTVLANEQIIAGRCERCDTEVLQKELEQWFFKITDYADRLIDDLDDLDWPKEIKDAQREWVGKSKGARLDFVTSNGDSVSVFTTRPDTLFGATYLVLAPEYEKIDEWMSHIENKKEVEEYRKRTARKKELERKESKEKTGVELKGITARNPATNEEVPLWIADYVLAGYGTGSIMAVPAHDERDYEFAQKFILPVKQVIAPHVVDKKNIPQKDKKTVRRNMVHGIVYDPKTDTYLTLRWKKNPWTTFVVGGVDEDEDSMSAVLREIEEETGYTNLVFKKTLGGIVCSEYFAAHKNENRFAHVQGYLFEVGPETKHTTPDDSELEKHEPVWMTLKEFEADPNMTCAEYGFWKERFSKDVVYTGEGLLINSGEFNGTSSEEAKMRIIKKVNGEETEQYRLRDWLLSRQRYWGCPIPIVYDPEGNPHEIPEEHLPWVLPEDVDFMPTGEAPLARSKELKERTEKIFGKGWTPEIDTMDTFVDSSWYFLRYLDSKNDKEFMSKEKERLWMPVVRYSGGAEHTTMHVLYSRFFQKALFDLGLVKDKEPYTMRMNRSLILGPDGAKMSKSKGNVVNPDEHVRYVGADAVKMYLAFIGPYNETSQYPWDPNSLAGIRRFLERAWGLCEKVGKGTVDSEAVILLLNQTIKKVGNDIEVFKFNTAISQMMILVNTLEKEKKIGVYVYETFLKLLAPFAPHIVDELWERGGHSETVHREAWPEYNEKIIAKASLTITVQVNGKMRGTFVVAPTITKDELIVEAKKVTSVAAYLEGKNILKEIVVPGRLVSFVVEK